MPCDTRLKKGQSISQRAEEVRAATNRVMSGILQSRIKIKIGPQGAIAFEGLTDGERDGVTDACIYRRIMATGPVTVKAAIQRAEQMSGRSISRDAITQGHHSHDGGKTWHHGH